MINYKLNKIAALLLILSASFLFTNCSDDENPVNADQGNTAKIEGRVTGSSGFSKTTGLNKTNSIEGATVIIAEVQSNGSLSTVSSSSVKTDAQGRFTVETNSMNAKNLVVVAQKNNVEWKAVVSAETKSGSTIYCPPVNDETTAEAEVYSEVVAEGEANTVSYADVQYYIDSEIAAKIKGNSSMRAQLVSALKAEARAKSKAFASSYFQTSASTMESVNNAKAMAQIELEASLNAAGESSSGYDAAFKIYEQAVIDAYANAGVEKSECFKIIEISSNEMLRVSSAFSGEIHFALMKRAAKREALAKRKAQEEEFDSAGAQQEQKNTVVSAGVTLTASIDAASSASEIEAAFKSYHDTVVEQLKITFQSQESAIVSIDSSINSSGGLKAVLEASIIAAINTDAIVNAYLKFYNDCENLVETEMSTASSVQVESASEILLIANS